MTCLSLNEQQREAKRSRNGTDFYNTDPSFCTVRSGSKALSMLLHHYHVVNNKIFWLIVTPP